MSIFTARARRTLCIVASVMAFLVISGCAASAPPEGGDPPQAIEPALVKDYEVEGVVRAEDPGLGLSPDGKHVLAVVHGPSGTRMTALPVSPDAPEERPLHSADADWIRNHLFGYRPLGWLSESECLFLAFGWQNDGPNAGRRGVSFRVGDIEAQASEETAFIDLPEGNLKTARLSNGAAYVHVSGAIWEYDVESRSVRPVKQGLPTYDGLFVAELSPAGRYFCYRLQGVFVLDLETGEERPLLPTGETMSFCPAWSPDGRFIAAYTVDRLEDSAHDYRFLPAEDGPQPAGDAITVVTPEGELVKKIEVEGKMLFAFKWGPGSDAIGFVSVTVDEGDLAAGRLTTPRPDGIWLASLQPDRQAPRKLADVGEPASFVTLAAIDPDGKGAAYNEYSEEGCLLRRARLDSAPEPSEFEGFMAEATPPVMVGDAFAGILRERSSVSAWLFDSRSALQLARFEDPSGGDGFADCSVLGFDQDTLVIAHCPLGPGRPERSTVRVFAR